MSEVFYNSFPFPTPVGSSLWETHLYTSLESQVLGDQWRLTVVHTYYYVNCLLVFPVLRKSNSSRYTILTFTRLRLHVGMSFYAAKNSLCPSSRIKISPRWILLKSFQRFCRLWVRERQLLLHFIVLLIIWIMIIRHDYRAKPKSREKLDGLIESKIYLI